MDAGKPVLNRQVYIYIYRGRTKRVLNTALWGSTEQLTMMGIQYNSSQQLIGI